MASTNNNVANKTEDQDLLIAAYSDEEDALEEDMDALDLSHASGDLLETSHTSDASQWETSRADKSVQSVKSRNNNAWLTPGSGNGTESSNKPDARSRRRSRLKGGSGIGADGEEEEPPNGRGIQIANLDLYVDDWENDDDVGYIYVNLSDDEFFAMVEEDAVHQAEEAMPTPKLGWGRLQQWRPPGRTIISGGGAPGDAEEDDDAGTVAGATSEEYEDAMNEDLIAAEAAIARHAADLQKTATTKEGVDVAHNDKGSVKAQNKDTDIEGANINDVDSQAATGTISQAALPSSFGGSQRHSLSSLQSLALTLDEDTVVTAEMGSGGGGQEAPSKQGLGQTAPTTSASSGNGGGNDGDMGEGEDLDSLAATGSTSRGGGFSEATSEGGVGDKDSKGGLKGSGSGSSSSSSSSADKLSQGTFGVLPSVKTVSSSSDHPVVSNDKSATSSSSSGGQKASLSSLPPHDNTTDRMLDTSGSGSGSALDKDDSGFGLESEPGQEPTKTEGNSSSSTPATAAAVSSATTSSRTSAHPSTTTAKGGGAPSSSKIPKAATIKGQQSFDGIDGSRHCFFNLKVIFDPYRTGFEEDKNFSAPKGSIIAGRYEVDEVLGQAAFSTALQCVDLMTLDEQGEPQWVCLKVIKNSKDFFDQSLDEIKLLQYINSNGDPDHHHVLRLVDYFYCKEHLFIVSELLRDNLYEFGRFIRENDQIPYFTIPRLKLITKQVLEALKFIHSLDLIHCDIKPENIVIKSFSRCEVKLIDFGSSCFTTDHLTTYIQSRSYRAPEVIIGHPYDGRIDLWSVGCVLAEMHTGYVLFQNDSVASMLSRITGVLGPFPPKVLAAGRDTFKYFTLANVLYEKTSASAAANASDPSVALDHSTNSASQSSVDAGGMSLIYPKRASLPLRLHCQPVLVEDTTTTGKGAKALRPSSSDGNINGAGTSSSSTTVNESEKIRVMRWSLTEEDALFVDFVACLLHLDPRERLTATEALMHPWLDDAREGRIDLKALNEQRDEAMRLREEEQELQAMHEHALAEQLRLLGPGHGHGSQSRAYMGEVGFEDDDDDDDDDEEEEDGEEMDVSGDNEDEVYEEGEMGSDEEDDDNSFDRFLDADRNRTSQPHDNDDDDGDDDGDEDGDDDDEDDEDACEEIGDGDDGEEEGKGDEIDEAINDKNKTNSKPAVGKSS